MLTHLKNRLQNQRITKRLTTTFVCVMTALIAVILLISNGVLYWSAIRKTEKEVRTSCDVIAMQLETVSNNASFCLKTLTKDINRIYHGDTVFSNDVDAISTEKAIYTALDYERFCFPDISSLIFADGQGRVVVSGKLQELGAASARDLDKLIEQIPKKGLADVKELEAFPLLMDEKASWVLGHRVIDMDTGKNIGYLFAVIFSDTLSHYFPEKDDMGYSSEYQLVNAGGYVIASRDESSLFQAAGSEKFLKTLQEKDSFRIREKDGHFLVTGSRVGEQGWKLVNCVQISELTREIRLLLGIIMMAGLLGIFFSVVVIRKISQWITRPIHELTETAQQFRMENISVRCDVSTKDEVGELAGVFNEMLERIECQMEDIRRGQRQKREYELALLQAQIKPHFLYNTLDLIYIFCQMKNPQGAARVAKAMADYYRTSLSSGKEIITIADEVKNISGYLLIQKERYSDKIDFSISVDQDIYVYAIPKMTLQPLVENSIYHGLKSKGAKGTVHVKGKQEGDFLCLVVEDDGVGMPEEVRSMVLENTEDSSSGHFGLTSVHRRIGLYYGAEYGLKVESSPGNGTRVIIRIPKKGAEEWSS